MVPEIALREVADAHFQRVSDPLLRQLDREAMLAWNPRLVRIRPNAAKIVAKLPHALAI